MEQAQKKRNDDGADVEYDCSFCNGTGVDFDQLKQMNKENPNTMTTKEELDEAIEYIESLKHWMNLPDPKNLNTALTILTKYRDGELVEKSDQTKKVWDELDGMMKADPVLYEKILDTQGFSYHFNNLCNFARLTPPTNQTEPKCERCGGTGLVGKTIHTENGDFDADDQPCPECKPMNP